jgi:hypothetical protein
MMPIDESRLISVHEGAVQLELDVAVLERLLHQRGITLEEVRFLNPSSERAGWVALKQALFRLGN